MRAVGASAGASGAGVSGRLTMVEGVGSVDSIVEAMSSAAIGGASSVGSGSVSISMFSAVCSVGAAGVISGAVGTYVAPLGASDSSIISMSIDVGCGS